MKKRKRKISANTYYKSALAGILSIVILAVGTLISQVIGILSDDVAVGRISLLVVMIFSSIFYGLFMASFFVHGRQQRSHLLTIGAFTGLTAVITSNSSSFLGHILPLSVSDIFAYNYLPITLGLLWLPFGLGVFQLSKDVGKIAIVTGIFFIIMSILYVSVRFSVLGSIVFWFNFLLKIALLLFLASSAEAQRRPVKVLAKKRVYAKN